MKNARVRTLLRVVLVCLSLAGGLSVAQGLPTEDTLAAARQMLVMLRLPPAHFRSDGSYGQGWDAGLGHVARRRTVERLARRLNLRVGEDWNLPSLGLACFVVEVPEGVDVDRIALRLAEDPDVESVEPVHEYHGLAAEARESGTGTRTYNDPLYPLQPTADGWHLAQLHAAATGRGVTLAIIDSAVDAEHSDLRGQIAVTRDFVGGTAGPETHGTAVAGIIAAVPDNRIGIAGVAPGARILALRACRQDDASAHARTTCRSVALLKALEFAVGAGTDIINLSLTGPADHLLARMIDAALDHGISVVAAAGPDVDGDGFPASHPGVIAVHAAPLETTSNALTAPGRDIPTTLPQARWGLVTGSSFATAEVSGLIALLRELERRGPPRTAWWSSRALRIEIGPAAARGPVAPCALMSDVAGSCICSCLDHPEAARLAAPPGS